jgi:hypothetical protein
MVLGAQIINNTSFGKINNLLSRHHGMYRSKRTASALVDAVSLSEWITTLAVPVKS